MALRESDLIVWRSPCHSINPLWQKSRCQPHPSVSGSGLAQSLGEIGVEHAVEEMLAGFAADRQPPGHVSARAEPALHGIADGHIFVLDFFADGDAFFMTGFGGGAGVGEVIVENYRAAIYAERQHQIGVHHAFVGVDHEVGILPKIKRAALPGRRDPGLGGRV